MGDIYIKVTDDENSTEPMELPLESDRTVFLSSITAQFPGACGLKYRSPDTQTMRGLKLVDGIVYMPDSQEFWQDFLYIAVFPKDNKRKMDDADSETQGIRSKRPAQKCSDLIVLGLPWELTEADLEEYFSPYGELVMVQIKRDENKKSKGYGFIRYSTFEAQQQACKKRHHIKGRWCEVKVPHSKENLFSPKIFVGQITEKITKEDLLNFFSEYGAVHDVYIPKPFRAFAFVTFEDAEVAHSLIGEDLVVNGCSVYISNADPKRKRNTQQQQQQGGYGFSNYSQGGGFDGGHHSHSGGPPRYGGYNNQGGPPPHQQGGNFPNNNQFNMNPAMLAAAISSWSSMMNGMANQMK